MNGAQQSIKIASWSMGWPREVRQKFGQMSGQVWKWEMCKHVHLSRTQCLVCAIFSTQKKDVERGKKIKT